MAGERDLDALLAGLDPVLHPEVLVFATVPPGADVPGEAERAAFARIEEAEGTTLVLPAPDAERLGLAHEMPSRRIEMRVHSALEAVGLTAALSTALATAGISANVVAAFHHDHVLVPAADADRALALLRDLSGAGWTAVLDGEVAIALRPSGSEWGGLDVRLGVRGAGVTADVESWWDVEPVEDLERALSAVADGSLEDRVVDGGRGPTIWLRSRERVDGLWEVEVTASGSARDATATVATTLERAACAAAAARVRDLLAHVGGGTD